MALYNCASKDGADLTRCLPNLVSEAHIEKVTKPVHCIETAKSEKGILACTKKFGVDTKGLDCIEQAGSDKEMALKCIAAKDPTLKSIADADACLKKAGDDNVKCAACASKMFGQDKAVTKAAACAALTDAGRVSCLVKATGLGKDAEKAATLTTCLGDATKGADEHATCLATAAGLDPGRAKIALCLGSGKSALDCAAGDKDLSQGVMAYKCASAAGDSADMLENCSEALNFGDKKTVKTAACLARSQGDSTKIGMCAASNVLNLTDDQRRLLDCAAVSQGAVEYALCISGVNMNAEFRTAAQCVASTGGEPISSASCTAGRLSLREFQKCAASGMKIGSDDCFGKNNTIRKYYEQLAKVYSDAGKTVFNDLTRGPGDNNTIVVAVRDVGKIAGDAQATAVKATEDVAKGVVHVQDEARKVAENVAAAAQKATEEAKKVLEGAVNAVGGAIQSFGNAISNCCRFSW